MDVTARSWSYKMQGNRLAGNVGCDKPIRQVCLKFTMGRCFRGELCKYLYGYHEYATSTSDIVSVSDIPADVKKKANKKNKKKRSKMETSACYEEPMKEEVENIILADKHKIENDQNAQLRNQVTQLLQVEKEQKLQIRERDTTIQNLQDKIEGLEQQLNEALRSAESRSGSVPDSNLKAAEDNVDSSAVLKKLVEELVMDLSQPQPMRVYARRKVKPRQQQQQFTAAEQITTAKNTSL
ncbi:uncharacterized protein LOC110722208 [Chenopodium quinoa]|uniref:uncharacterized protein LOC110700733 n=1 Tax=Chenopodium quinoa TaxID=63459 RepID=UPI000B798A82|nr:uncharacterized protein LOC110700733 [Chenopodium quinoa]XP_021757167.1 uncharacterized protein LOC110722208 [Chenopodium quinoa]